MYLDQPFHLSQLLHHDKPEELVDTIPDDKSSSLNTDNSVDNDILKQQIKNIFNWLNTREKTVITLRFGLDDGKARTQKEVGKFLNVSAERIRQIEFKALKRY